MRSTEAVDFESLPTPPARDLNESQVLALYEALQQRGSFRLRDSALVVVLAHGLRANEVEQLDVGHYDGVRLHIRQAKADSTGTVPLSRQARKILDEYLESCLATDNALSADAPLFVTLAPNCPGQRLKYKGIYRVVKTLGAIAEIPNLTPHRLRHTFATNLLLWGMDSLHARTLTRHKSEGSFKRYAKRAMQAAAERAYYEAIGEDCPEERQTEIFNAE
ncbi:site-specific integrase [Synechococcus sp. PCC 7336]|uniref:tyrosine-type recombinase/integrase n=1 Tax=Synechococcus sp. PCC 7336 TaxID=195250 RepID=UPI000349DBC5|nr:site-specific integrase [Synechococcus sp. PCC 7336]